MRDPDAPMFSVGPHPAGMQATVQACNRALRKSGYSLLGEGASAVVLTGLVYMKLAEVPRELMKKMCCGWIDAMFPPSC